MPRAKNDDAKSSAELDAEIKEMEKRLATKKKALKVVKRREDREAEQAREYEENQFNREFVEMAKVVTNDMLSGESGTVYEWIRGLLRSPVYNVVKGAPEEERTKTLRDVILPDDGIENPS